MAASEKNVIRISLFLSIVSWIALVITDLTLLFSTTNSVQSGIPPILPHIFLDVFIISIFFFYKFRIGRIESTNFTDLLWRVFVTGLLATILSLGIQLFLSLLPTLGENPYVKNLRYDINLGLLSSFLISTFVVWQRLILYQKSKNLIRLWNIYEYSLVASILLNLISGDFFYEASIVILIVLMILGFVLSVNLKWVAYLNFKQKWKGILLIILIILYLGYFLQFLYNFQADAPISRDLLDNIFYIASFVFVSIYSFFSMLVILFNLPTSSVFEQKLEEVGNFQRLSQSIQTESSEEKVYEILLESSISTVSADAAWLEIVDDDEKSTLYTSNIEKTEIDEVKNNIKSNRIKGILDTDTEKNVKGNKNLSALKGTRFKSIVAYPLIVQKHQMGTLALLKDVVDGFNKEMIEIIRTFVNQAGISIENFRLLQEALENERYKEELKIAKQVQSSLLPESLDHHSDTFKVAGFSMSAAEVGGDYYDTLPINENRTAIIIGDVSGKGTSAAFHMSQLKGIFSSLAQLDITPDEFMVRANIAVSLSLEKNSFITASYFVIDVEDNTVSFVRAGHCPTLFYSASKKKAAYFESKGLGLGILRNNDFSKYVKVEKIDVKPGDILFLYTDGITEAKNTKNDEFGYDRLLHLLEENKDRDPEEIKDVIIESIFEFCGNVPLDDDYTALIVKFN